jgi:ferredoxin
MIRKLRQWLFPNSKETVGNPPPPSGFYQVAADASRCVQCGICGFNCPVGIEVREYARRGQNVTDSRCITCGTCIEKCPRGTLRWGPAILLREDNRALEVNPDALPTLLQLQPWEVKR